MEGLEVFSIAEVRDGLPIVYGEGALSMARPVAGASSSSSCGADCRLRMPPPPLLLAGEPREYPAPEAIVEGHSTRAFQVQPRLSARARSVRLSFLQRVIADNGQVTDSPQPWPSCFGCL